MKKIFTLIALACMAISVNAQKITFSEEIAAGNLNGKVFSNGEFKLTLTDTDNKMAVDANSQFFGTAEEYESYSFRLKSGGKSSSKNQMLLTIPTDGTLNICARSSSGNATDRNVILTQNGTELYNQVVKDADAITVSIEGEDKKVFPVISVAVNAGEVSITYPVNGLNFYCFELVSGSANINAVKAEKSGAAYNLAGQKVGAGYKGLVIQNGRKIMK